jgi:hypothetical protein
MSESLLGGNSAPPTEAIANSNATSTPNETPISSVVIPENWKDSLPDDLKSDPSLSSILDVQALAKSYVHGQKLIGKDKIVIPDKFATEDDWQKIYQKLGVPESVDKYDLKVPETIDEDFVKGFKDLAVKTGIHPKQAEKLFDFYGKYVEGVIQNNESENKRAFEESIGNLKKEWGQGYDKKIQAASGLFKSLADEETTKFFNESGVGNNPTVIKLFAKLAEQLGEDKFVNATNIGSMGLTPAEAQTKINQIYGNKDHPYFNKSHPSHQDALKEMSKLFDAISIKS